MRHRVAGRALSRTSSHRRALRRNQAASLFQHGAIRTTEAKAKELRRFAEKLITIAKKGTLHARRRVISLLQDREMVFVKAGGQNPSEDIEYTGQTVVQKLFTEIAPKYANRPGGYTRIIRLADRRIGDAGQQVLLQLVEESIEEHETAVAGKRKARAAKRHDAIEAAVPTAKEAPAEEVVEEAPVEETEVEATEEAPKEA
jgi:large subunit ribosomal protein L17